MLSLKKQAICCFLFAAICKIPYAQDGKKLRYPTPDNQVYHNQCQQCDSIALEYLVAGDTSMAIYYYQQYVDAHPEDVAKKDMLQRQTRLYNSRQSFYLTDH
jgi:hypothetical protein